MRTVYVDGLANVLDALERAARAVRLRQQHRRLRPDATARRWTRRRRRNRRRNPGRVVLEAERLLRERRPDAVVLRFAGIYGPGRLIREKDVRAGEALSGDPEQWLNLIHVEDGAAAVAAALERGRPGAVYNVCDDQPVRRRDFYTRMAELLGAPPPWFPPPVEGARRTESIAESSTCGCGRNWGWRRATRVMRRDWRRPFSGDPPGSAVGGALPWRVAAEREM